MVSWEPERETCGVLSAASKCTLLAFIPGGRFTRTPLLGDGNQFSERAFHHHRIGQVHQVNGHGMLLPPNGNVQHARARTPSTSGSSFVAQATALASKRPWSRREDVPEGAINVPGKISNAAWPRSAKKNLGRAGFRGARVDLFHRQIRIGRNQRERHGSRGLGSNFKPPDAVDDARGIFETLQEERAAPGAEGSRRR